MNQVELEQLADDLLLVIRKQPKQTFEITMLAKKLNSERTEIYGSAKLLKNWGYGLKLSKSEIAFSHAADTLSTTEISFHLKTKIIGQHLVSFHSVKSTNDIASQMAAGGADEGVVITSEKQTLGRGRLGRSWHSPEKAGAYLSIVLRPKIPPDNAPGISIMTALAAAETLEKYCPGKVKIKWPNDVSIGGRKVAGILTELYTKGSKIDYVIVGIGININQAPKDFPKSVRKIATSLRQSSGKKINRAGVEIARNDMDGAHLALEGRIRDLKAEVGLAYWDLYYARANLEVEEQLAQGAQRVVETVATREKMGTGTRSQILEAEVGLARREEAIVVAEGQLRDAEDWLRARLGLNENAQAWNTRIAAAHLDDPDTVDLDLVGLAFVPRHQAHAVSAGGKPTRGETSLVFHAPHMVGIDPSHFAIRIVSDDADARFPSILRVHCYGVSPGS